MTDHRTLDQLQAAHASSALSPRDSGKVEMLVIRPETDARSTPPTVTLSVADGIVGDRWGDADSPAVASQVSLINSKVLEVVAGDRDRWPFAGDNLVVDLDLSVENLPPGTRIQVGSAVLEMTAQAHTGCSKFAGRFGEEALRFVNLGDGPALRLRGAYARVVEDGVVNVGDAIAKQ